MKTKNKYVILILLLIHMNGCNSSDNPSDTPTTGNLIISADETYQPVTDTEISTFESIYSYADIKVNYKPETDVFNDLMNDSIRLIIVSRNLNEDEIEQFKRWEIVPRVTKIGYDAVVLVGSKDLKDTVYSLKQISSLLSKEDKSSSIKKIKVVFDNNNSSTISFLKQKTGAVNFSENCYALNSSKAVLEFVRKEKNCIGIIGVNWISDQDDSNNVSFLKTVKVLEVAADENSESFKPYQAYIAQKKYPLTREMYVVSKEAYNGLGTGFTAFLASERGQRIILKFGLVPATMPIRLVEIVNEEL